MRAFQIRELGQPWTMASMEEPEVSRLDIKVEVTAAGLNPVDNLIRLGYFTPPHLSLPFVLGCEAAGRVVQIGSAVTKFRVGDRVAGMINFRSPEGRYDGAAFADYAVAPESQWETIPESVDAGTAAALPAAGLTAYQSIFEHARLGKGQSILIAGASGGVGHIAVQLAAKTGARVIATGSPPTLEFIRGLKTDVVVDRSRGAFEQQIPKGLDAALIPAMGQVAYAAAGALKPGGKLISLVPFSSEVLRAAKNSGAEPVLMGVIPHSAQLALLMKWVSDKQLIVNLKKVYSFEDLALGQEALAKGGVKGKIIVSK